MGRHRLKSANIRKVRLSFDQWSISEFELGLLKDKAFQQRLGGFSRWEQENLPAETDLAALKDDIEA